MTKLPVLALALLPLLSPSLRAAEDRVAESSSGRYPDAGDQVLFPLDDVTIPWRDNLKMTLERPAKFSGNPVMSADPAESPDGYGAVLYGTVIKEHGLLRMWYLASPRIDNRVPGDEKRMYYYRPTAYAESSDGIHWRRPNLGLVEFRGNKNNNLVLIEPSTEPYARDHDFVAVLLDPSDPDSSRRYKMAYITRDLPRRAASTATAVSPDGLHWRLANTAMITKGHFENTSLVRFGGLYYLSGQNLSPYDGSAADGSPVGRVMKIFFSPDFRHWSNGRAFAFYRSDYDGRALHAAQESHMGAALWNRGNVLLGFYGRWHGDTIKAAPDPAAPLKDESLIGLTIDLGLVVSNDAIHYREPVRNWVAIPHGADADWDAHAVLQANAFANVGTETLIWYGNWNTARTDAHPFVAQTLPGTMARQTAAVGLARLPRDRFGYFSKLLSVSRERNPAYNIKRDASCLSRPFALSHPSRLYANVDWVSAAAPLEIALVDDAERPLDGYTAVLDSDSLKKPIVWAGGKRDLPQGYAFRVKVTWPVGVDQARLYALYIEHE